MLMASRTTGKHNALPPIVYGGTEIVNVHAICVIFLLQ